jgi:hypothetical protein
MGHIWGVWTWAPGMRVGPGHKLHIGWAKAVAVELRLQPTREGNLVGPGAGCAARVLVRSNNAGVVAIVNKGWAQDQASNNVLRRTYHKLAQLGVTLVAKHVPGVINIADALLWGDVAGFLTAFLAARTRTSITLPTVLDSILMPFA